MVDTLSGHNDNLLKENDSLKAEMHNNKFTSSAHEIFLQMKTKEETEKTIELQQQLDVLQDDLCRKNTLISKLEKSNRITKESMEQQKKLHQSEMQQLTNKLHLLTQLSQEEIQQTFHVTIQELQSILDQNGGGGSNNNNNNNNDNNNSEQKHIENDNDIDIDTEHLLSPKINPKPHITDSEAEDADIIEAEDKLASYFARHKQRQLTITTGYNKNSRNNSVEPIPENSNESEDDDGKNNDKPQIIEDDDGNEDILTPPLQEEAPYIVDDTLSIDRAISNVSNVSISNVAAASNCSTRGASTRGDTTPVSDINDDKMDQNDDIKNDEVNLANSEKDKSPENDHDGMEDMETKIVITNDTPTPNTNDDDDDELKIPEPNKDDVRAVLEALPQFLSNTASPNGDDQKSESRILHSLQTFLSNDASQTPSGTQTGSQSNVLSPNPLQQTRQRSMGSVLSIQTIDDVVSIDPSMLAHDGSRDGSVVPEQAIHEMFPDDHEEIITHSLTNTGLTASNSNVNINIFPLPQAVQEEYNPTPDATQDGAETTIHSVDMNVSVDEIHNEAHQIIDQLQQNLKEISNLDEQQHRQQQQQLPTIIQESVDGDLPSISNSAILQPLIARKDVNGDGDGDGNGQDEEKMRKILAKAKDKWSAKVDEMISNTDQWFINEDGDIVLIYPDANQVNKRETENENDNKDDMDKLKDIINIKQEKMVMIDNENDEDNKDNLNHEVKKQVEDIGIEGSGVDENNDDENIDNAPDMENNNDENVDIDDAPDMVNEDDKEEEKQLIKSNSKEILNANDDRDTDDELDNAPDIDNKNEKLKNNDKSNSNKAAVKKNENFFNTFRIF